MRENNFKVNPKSLKTAVSRVEKDKIVTRGYNQRDLIEKIRYSDMVFLLLKGRLPSLRVTDQFCNGRGIAVIWKQACRSH